MARKKAVSPEVPEVPEPLNAAVPETVETVEATTETVEAIETAPTDTTAPVATVETAMAPEVSETPDLVATEEINPSLVAMMIQASASVAANQGTGSAGLRPPKAALPELGRFGLAFNDLPRWMQYAFADYGTEEVAGPKANARIVEYHQHTSLKAGSDEVPWCAAFVCAMLEKAGFKSTRKANAKSYLTFGEELPGPKVGAIAVLNRGTDPASGHVGFVVGFNSNSVYLLGGNQSNMVRVSSFQRWRVLQYRWPVEKLPALAIDQPKGGK